MNILYIWDSDYPWDIRVDKICSSLVNSDNHVWIAARNLNKQARIEKVNGVNIHRLPIWNNDKLNYTFSFPVFFNPVWKNFLDQIIIHEEIKIIIVRDLPMAIAGIWAGKKHQIPVIFDMAEDYVAMIRDIWKYRKFHGLNLIVRNPYLAQIIERYVIRHIDHILVVVDEAKKVIERNDGDMKKVTIVSNTPILRSKNDNSLHSDEILKYIKDHYSVIYTGGIQLGRGLQNVINAIPILIKKIPDFLFVVVGDGYATETIKKMIDTVGVEKYVLWIGWSEHRFLHQYIKACRVGIIPHHRTEHTDTTIPNKIFDYMAAGIPVVSSNAIPLKRIIRL